MNLNLTGTFRKSLTKYSLTLTAVALIASVIERKLELTRIKVRPY